MTYSWDISKTIEFCYGHRVWSQKLDKDLALTEHCKCRHLHGHEAKIVVHLQSDNLKNGMVTDFNHLNWLKELIDEIIDHKFIIDRSDPLFSMITHKPWSHSIWYPYKKDGLTFGYYLLPADIQPKEWDYYESFFVVDFVPTSENLAKWMYDNISKIMWNGYYVAAVEWHETPKSKAIYRRK